MNIIKAELAATAVWPEQFPSDGRPEFAFAGRSNVGKSSLINALMSRKSLARASKQPGKTRTINFYAVEPRPETPCLSGQSLTPEQAAQPIRLYFADLPGYGYAKVSKSESAKWGAMAEGYLKNRPQLLCVFILLDIRHEPTAGDRMLYDWCVYYGLKTRFVATKCDKIKRSQYQKHLATLKRAFSADAPPLAFSSETKEGRNELWALMIDIMSGHMI